MDWLKKNRNLLLVVLLFLTLVVSWLVSKSQTGSLSPAVTLPMKQSAQTVAPAGKLESYKLERDEASAADRAALQALCDNEQLDAQTREDAAAHLTQLIERTEKQVALEGALQQSGLYPCVAVLSEGALTIVTEKATLSSGESALVLELAKAHTGIDPAGVRVVTAEEK